MKLIRIQLDSRLSRSSTAVIRPVMRWELCLCLSVLARQPLTCILSIRAKGNKKVDLYPTKLIRRDMEEDPDCCKCSRLVLDPRQRRESACEWMVVGWVYGLHQLSGKCVHRDVKCKQSCNINAGNNYTYLLVEGAHIQIITHILIYLFIYTPPPTQLIPHKTSKRIQTIVLN